MSKQAWKRMLAALGMLVGLAGVLVVLMGVLSPPAVQADDLVVTNTSDNDPGSLRQAMAAAASGDTIIFDLSYPATITLTSGELLIGDDLTIEGPGADKLTISGDESSRVLHITAGTVTISGLTVADGQEIGPAAWGGCIRNDDTLTLDEVTVRNCRAEGDYLSGAWGGAIFSDGDLRLRSCQLLDNEAQGGPGVTSFDNAMPAYGGGIFNSVSGSLRIRDSRLENNVVRGADNDENGGHAYGGAIASFQDGSVNIQTSILAGNRALGGESQNEIGGSALGGGVYTGSPLVITASSMSGNVALGGVGLGRGGFALCGALCIEAGSATIEGSSLAGNRAQGGDARSTADGGDAWGGGIRIGEDVTLTVQKSALRDNVVQGGNSPQGDDGRAYGGAFSTAPPPVSTDSSVVNLINSTVSGNQALSDREAFGGGLYVREEPRVKLAFCTVADNEAGDQGGGLYAEFVTAGKGAFLKSTIVGDNTAPSGPDVLGTVNSGGHNLIEDDPGDYTLDTSGGNTGAGNKTGVDPKLGPLQDNGGPLLPTGQSTWTHAPLEKSFAIDHGANNDYDLAPVTTDQRGAIRPFGLKNDIGAHEKRIANLALAKGVVPQEAYPGEIITFTLTLTNTGSERATGVVLTDVIPISLTNAIVVSSTLALTDTGASPPFVWTLEEVIPRYVEVITLTAVLSSPLAAGTFTNTAVISTTAAETDQDDNEAQAPITVLNAAPVAVDDSYTASGKALAVAAPGVLTNDTDDNGDPLTAIKDSDPLSGTLTLKADGSFVYTSPVGFEGTATFTYQAHDGAADSNLATVSITVEPYRIYLPVITRE